MAPRRYETAALVVLSLICGMALVGLAAMVAAVTR